MLVALAFPAFAQKEGRTLEQEVARQIRLLPYYGVFDHIEYKVEGDVVTLSGYTISLGTRSQIENVLRRQPGVAAVINNIEELPPSRYDDQIRLAALRTFVNRGPAQYFSEIDPDVRIIVKNGNMILEGNVLTNGDKNLLNVLGNSIPGVFSVTNNLRVTRAVS
jgi:hypothetical protein